MKRNVYEVWQVNAYIKNMFSQDFMLRDICVAGEVSNCKYHSSGHIYFTIKDKRAAISAVMFAGSRGGLSFRMQEGDKVRVAGSIEVYERDGRYQLYAREIEKDGEGSLYLKFEALKRELLEMGMFAEEYKKPVPRYVRTLGVVTAPTGAAVQDIRNIARRRNPYAQVILYPARVQGDGAAQSVAEGIRALDAMRPDAIIVGRGGGSIEDLQAFNEEIVARAIFECETPVISAVGHETDTTIADFVADLRAPTPSAGAELAICDIFEIMAGIESYGGRLSRSMHWKLEASFGRCREFLHLLRRKSPESLLREKRQHADGLEAAFEQEAGRRVAEAKYRLGLLAGRLDGASPAKKLSQGLAFVTDASGARMSGVSGASKRDTVRIIMRDGSMLAEVTDVTLRKWQDKGGGQETPQAGSEHAAGAARPGRKKDGA